MRGHLRDITSRFPLSHHLTRMRELWSPVYLWAINRHIDLSRVIPAMLQRGEQDEPTHSVQFVGLVNRGNFCYQNSVLQGLASLSAFGAFVEYHTGKIDGAIPTHTSSRELYRILTRLARGSSSKEALDIPQQLNLLGDDEQQDAQEYLARLLETIDKEIKARARVIRNAEVIHDARLLLEGTGTVVQSQTGTTRLEALIENQKVDWAREYLANCAKMPLSGSMLQVMHCHDCDDRGSPQVTEFTCLTLNLSSMNDQTIENLIDEHVKPEVMDTAIECESCTQIAGGDIGTKIRSTKAKQLTFGALPNNLVIHINRSTVDMLRGTLRKNTAAVHFGSILSIPARWTTDFKQERLQVEAAYELRAVVTHRGDHGSGHYLTYGKRDKRWYRLNDEYVRECDEQDVLLQSNVFMLFYDRLSPVPELEAPASVLSNGDAALPQRLASEQGIAGASTSSSSQSSQTESEWPEVEVPGITLSPLTDEAEPLTRLETDEVSESSEIPEDEPVLRTLTNTSALPSRTKPPQGTKSPSEDTAAMCGRQ